MEESKTDGRPGDLEKHFILQFVSHTGLTLVLEFPKEEEMESYKSKIEDAGMKCVRLPKFNVQFDQADFFMDLRSSMCRAQFDLEDWL